MERLELGLAAEVTQRLGFVRPFVGSLCGNARRQDAINQGAALDPSDGRAAPSAQDGGVQHHDPIGEPLPAVCNHEAEVAAERVPNQEDLLIAVGAYIVLDEVMDFLDQMGPTVRHGKSRVMAETLDRMNLVSLCPPVREQFTVGGCGKTVRVRKDDQRRQCAGSHVEGRV